MNRDKYDEVIVKIEAGWPPDRFERKSETEVILTCDNGTFIKFALMEMPEEMLNDPETPQMTKDMLHNKLLIQWTDDLSNRAYKNLGFYLHKSQRPEREPMDEALKELTFRVQIGAALR